MSETLKPGLQVAIQRLDAVQVAVRTEAASCPEEVTAQPTVVYEVPSLAEWAQWKNETRVSYMGQPYVAHEIPAEPRRRRQDSRNHLIGSNGGYQSSTNGHEVVSSVAAKPNQEPVVVVPNVPTQLVGGVAARIGGKPW